MIEILLHTGEYFSGENYYNKGSVFNGVGFIQSDKVGQLQITANGQTLHETAPEITISGLKTFYNNTGQFFLSGFELRTGNGSLNIPSNASLDYDWVSDTGRFFYHSNIHAEMISGFSGIIGDMLSGGHVFLNGQKLVSGSSYLENAGVWTWTDSDTEITGVLFSMSSQHNSYMSGSYDSLYSYFNRNGFTAYLNGIKLAKTDFYQLGSVTLDKIDTGLQPCLELNDTDNEQVFYL